MTLDLTKESKEVQDFIKATNNEIKNLKISLNAQLKISTIATNELNKMKGRIKDAKVKTQKEIIANDEKILKESEQQFKTRKFA